MCRKEQDEVIYARYLSERGEADLRVLLERHRESLTLFLFGFVGNMEDAEDLMMDAFAVVVSGTSRFSGRSSFKTWLFAIGRNLAMKHLRRQRMRPVELDDQAVSRISPEVDLLAQERMQKLYQAMAELNPDYRQVLYLLYFEDASMEEAAQIMGKNRKQVYNLASRGRQALKDILIRLDYADLAEF